MSPISASTGTGTRCRWSNRRSPIGFNRLQQAALHTALVAAVGASALALSARAVAESEPEAPVESTVVVPAAAPAAPPTPVDPPTSADSADLQNATPPDSAPAESTPAAAPAEPTTAESAPPPAAGRYLEAVSELESSGGAWDPALSQQLLGLAAAYQEAGRHAEAVRTLSRAAHITRINEGLYSTSDIPIIERLIESNAALGEWEAVSGNYQQLFQIHQRNYGERDPRMVPVLRNLSAWHLRAWFEAIGDDPLQHLVTARNLYDASLDIMRQAYGPTDPRLVDPLRERAIVDYYVAVAPRPTNEEPQFGFGPSMIASPQFAEGPATTGVYSFMSGRAALEQVVALRRADPASSPVDTAAAIAELADWNLLFSRSQTALDLYREAQSTIAQKPEVAPQATQELFGAPLELPVRPKGFGEVPGAPNYNAWIQVSFTVDDRGKPGEVAVVSAEPEPQPSALDRVRKTIRNLRFRPRFEGSQPVATSGLSYRYRYSL